MAECRARTFHFKLKFYSDPDLLNLVKEVDSRDYYQYFTVNGVAMPAEGAAICEDECVNVQFKMPNVPPTDLAMLVNRRLYCRIEKPVVIVTGVITTVPAKA